MVVVMSPDATAEQISAVVATVGAAGGSAFVSRGVARTIVGVVGDEDVLAGLEAHGLDAQEGVADVIRVTSPYKLVSREHHPHRSTVMVGGVPIGPETFTFIAGPCAVETPEQTLEAAQMAQAAGATLLRGGAYKPRTSPYAFQGLGEKGLQILADVSTESRHADRHRGGGRARRRRWSRGTPTCCRWAPATCRTSGCCRRWAAPGGR